MGESTTDPTEPPDNPEGEPRDIPSGARPHHYLFAREWLRQSFERRPEMMVLALARAHQQGEGAVPIRETWRGMGKSLPEQDRVEPEGIRVRTFEGGDDNSAFFAIIELPPPLATGEAHTIGLGVLPPDGQLNPEEDDQEGPRSGTEMIYGLAEATDSGPRLVVIDEGNAKPIEHGVTQDPGESLLMALRNRLREVSDSSD